MASLEIKEFDSLANLAKAYTRSGPLKQLGSSGLGLSSKAIEGLLAAPALIADWILRFEPSLKDRPELHIAVVSGRPAGFETIDHGRWYPELLPHLLGVEDMKVSVTLVYVNEKADETPTALDMFRLPVQPAKVFNLPLHAYLENQPDGPVDLLVLHEAELHIPLAPHWADELQRVAASGACVAAVTNSADEFELSAGLLSMFGFEVHGGKAHNRFCVAAPKQDGLAWGTIIWQVDSSRRSPGQEPNEGALVEVRNLIRFVHDYEKSDHTFPPLSSYGVLVSGEKSPAPDGSPLITLPRDLYYDPSREKFSALLEGGLVSLKNLDEYGHSSALLASYEGRTDSFGRILWAMRVFNECTEILPGLREDSDESDEDDDERVCPSCGGVHSATQRVDAMKSFLSELFEGESTRTKLRAALSLALEIVEHDPGMNGIKSEIDDLEDDDYLDDLQVFNALLERNYIDSAFAMLMESDDPGVLAEEGADEDGWSLLMLALANGNFLMVSNLLEEELCDATIEAEIDGCTVFHAVAEAEFVCPDGLLAILRDRGADPNSPDFGGVLPLEAAAYNENWSLVAQLLDIGADIRLTGLDPAELAEQLRDEFPQQADMLIGKKKKARSPRSKKTGKQRVTPTKRPAV
ncbi:hypothetical protein [Paraburkholderia youngii]|uniref:hypothetical protein n=1 Tax=Paraburkholderia youngii TaxID=2782701 RepID=UPI003D262D19